MTLDDDTIDTLSCDPRWDVQAWAYAAHRLDDSAEREASRRAPPVVRRAQVKAASKRHDDKHREARRAQWRASKARAYAARKATKREST